MSNAKALEAEAAIGAGLEHAQMDEHMRAMWAGQSNVLVSVRVRPLMKHDVVKKSCVRVLDSKVVVILDPATQKPDVLRVNRTREKQYAFDYVFEPSSSQDATYHHTTKFLIHGVLDGFNATVFAYGQTGSGKTFTMIGMQENPGIMVRVMSDLFSHSASNAKANAVNHKVVVSFLEVYNENIRDLLSDDTDEYLDLREDPIKGPVVAGITEVEAKSATEIMQLLHQGNAKRSQAATAANEVSSRSHAVLQVIVESRDRAPGVVDNIKVGKLSLIDLAGSERAANTQNRGARLVEGANINRSLLALGNCINALGEKGNKGNFVPYRDSKLTRLLKDSLGGNCRTVMIANISAAESSFEETLNTLKYANRAKNIKTEAKRNVLNVNYHISEYVELINNLRGEIKMLKDQIETNPTVEGGIGIGSPALVLPSEMMEGFANAAAAGSGNGDGGRLGTRPRGMQHLDIGAANAAAAANGGSHFDSRAPPSPSIDRLRNPSTPMQALRDSLKSGGTMAGLARGQQPTTGQTSENRELVNSMRQMIVSNFQERMQLRRSLIELEDQNVQNSIEVSKRQLMVVQWSESSGLEMKPGPNGEPDLGAHIVANAPSNIASAWRECEQIRKAVLKNNSMKRSIAKRLRHNEREAERVRDELGDKITGEDRRELMELQYQVGRLELENMELEQHRIVHESILKGKDLVIQKLKLQLAVKDKIIARQQSVLSAHGLEDEVGYKQLALLEHSLTGMEGPDPRTVTGSASGDGIDGTDINAYGNTMGHQQGYSATAMTALPLSSPPRAMGALGVGTYVGGMQANRDNGANRGDIALGAGGGGNKYPITQQRLENSNVKKGGGGGVSKGSGSKHSHNFNTYNSQANNVSNHQNLAFENSLDNSITSLDDKDGPDWISNDTDHENAAYSSLDNINLGASGLRGSKMFTSLAEPKAAPVAPTRSKGSGGGGGGGGNGGGGGGGQFKPISIPGLGHLMGGIGGKSEFGGGGSGSHIDTADFKENLLAPTSHHFFPGSNNSAGGGATAADSKASVGGAAQGGTVNRTERPRKRPTGGPTNAASAAAGTGKNMLSPRAAAASGVVKSEKRDWDFSDVGMGMHIQGRQPLTSLSQAQVPSQGSVHGQGQGQGQGRRMKPGYIPTSWEQKAEAKGISISGNGSGVGNSGLDRESDRERERDRERDRGAKVVSPIGVNPIQDLDVGIRHGMGDAGGISAGGYQPQNQSQSQSQSLASQHHASQHAQRQQQRTDRQRESEEKEKEAASHSPSGCTGSRGNNSNPNPFGDDAAESHSFIEVDTPLFSIERSDPGPRPHIRGSNGNSKKNNDKDKDRGTLEESEDRAEQRNPNTNPVPITLNRSHKGHVSDSALPIFNSKTNNNGNGNGNGNGVGTNEMVGRDIPPRLSPTMLQGGISNVNVNPTGFISASQLPNPTDSDVSVAIPTPVSQATSSSPVIIATSASAEAGVAPTKSRPTRPMGALGASRKRNEGGQNDSSGERGDRDGNGKGDRARGSMEDEGSVETVYSEDSDGSLGSFTREKDSNHHSHSHSHSGSGGKHKEKKNSSRDKGPSKTRIDSLDNNNDNDNDFAIDGADADGDSDTYVDESTSTPLPLPLTSADRAYQAAQAVSAAHAQAQITAQAMAARQLQMIDDKRSMPGAHSKMRKGGGGGRGQQQHEYGPSFASGANVGGIVGGGSVGGAVNDMNSIINSGSISRAQLRAEAGAGGGRSQRPKPRVSASGNPVDH